jgi:hypothetical protein
MLEEAWLEQLKSSLNPHLPWLKLEENRARNELPVGVLHLETAHNNDG